MGLLDKFLTPAVKVAGSLIGTRPTLNFVSGATAVDNPTTGAIDITTAGLGSVSYGAFSSRPAAGTAGRVFVASDGCHAWVDTGTAWVPFIPGHAIATEPGLVAGWTTWTVVGAAGGTYTATDSAGDIVISSTSGGADGGWSFGAITKTLPNAGAAYDIRVLLDYGSSTGAYPHAGLVLRDVAGGTNWLTAGWYTSSGLPKYGWRRDNTSVINTGVAMSTWGQPTFPDRMMWYRIVKTGATKTDGARTFYTSTNGMDWLSWFSESGPMTGYDTWGVEAGNNVASATTVARVVAHYAA